MTGEGASEESSMNATAAFPCAVPNPYDLVFMPKSTLCLDQTPSERGPYSGVSGPIV